MNLLPIAHLRRLCSRGNSTNSTSISCAAGQPKRDAANKEDALAAMTPAQAAAWEEKRGLEYGGAPSSVSVANPGGDCAGCAEEGGVSGGAGAPSPAK